MAEEELKQEELPLVDEKPAEAVPDKIEEAVEVAAEETPAEVKEPEAEPEKPRWVDPEIAAKHRQNKRLQEQLVEANRRAEAAEALAAKFNQTPKSDSDALSEGLVEQRVQQRLAQQKYLEESNKVDAAGKKIYGTEWKTVIDNLQGALDEQTIRGIFATSRKFGIDAPAKILHELSNKPERYDEIMALPYEERIVEMSEIVRQPATRQISSAPAPVSPVGGKAAPAAATLSDSMTDDQWFSTRRSQTFKKFKDKHL